MKKVCRIIKNSVVILFLLALQFTSAQNKPNIVLIMADDLGYGDLSCYGNTTIHTPNIDLLAANGVKFTDFHSNGSVCSPTRAALLTGKYQQRTGVSGVITAKSHREVGLSLKEVTIAEELKKQGYNSGIYGKWHLGYSKEFNPTLQGFDDFNGFVGGNIDYHAHIDQEGYLDWWNGSSIENEKGYSTDLITDYGVKYIQTKNPKITNKPFFLYLPHAAPHYPYQKRIDKFLRTESSTKTAKVNSDSITAIYKEMIEDMDEGVGRIVKTLKETNQYNNTLIFFISDNGANKYGSNGELRGYKAEVYEGGSRVPAIFSYPNKIKKGIVSNETVHSMDLLPTFLDFVGAKPSAKIDGRSIKTNLLNQKALPERDTFFLFEHRSFIRSGVWKLICLENKEGVKIELYNLSTDLQEQNDVSSSNLKLVKKLTKKLDKWKKEVEKGVISVS